MKALHVQHVVSYTTKFRSKNVTPRVQHKILRRWRIRPTKLLLYVGKQATTRSTSCTCRQCDRSQHDIAFRTVTSPQIAICILTWRCFGKHADRWKLSKAKRLNGQNIFCTAQCIVKHNNCSHTQNFSAWGCRHRESLSCCLSSTSNVLKNCV